jgi:hypothetical protein
MSIVNPAEQLKDLYRASTTVVDEINVPSVKILAVEGRGSPGSPLHIESAATLMSVSLALKAFLENEVHAEYGVMPLEGLWWTGDGSDWGQARDDNRFWKLIVVQPEGVTTEMLERWKNAVPQPKLLPLPSAPRLVRLHEGRAAQMLHIGPYADEERTVTRIFNWMRERGAKVIGKHHEIYLDDPARTLPKDVRTIIRYPFF